MSGPPPEHRTDQQLIAAIQAGQGGHVGGRAGDRGRYQNNPAEPFAALYHRHKDFALRIAWRYTTCDADALDAVQATFVYLAGKLAPGATPPFTLTAKLTTFLFPIVKHEALALRRKAARFKPTGPAGTDSALDELPARPPPADAGRSNRRIAAAVQSLPSAQREVVLLRFVDNLSMEEMSAALAIPVGTVKSRLHNAIKALSLDAEAVSTLSDGK